MTLHSRASHPHSALLQSPIMASLGQQRQEERIEAVECTVHPYIASPSKSSETVRRGGTWAQPGKGYSVR